MFQFIYTNVIDSGIAASCMKEANIDNPSVNNSIDIIESLNNAKCLVENND